MNQGNFLTMGQRQVRAEFTPKALVQIEKNRTDTPLRREAIGCSDLGASVSRADCSVRFCTYARFMHVEKLKYLIWAQDMARAVAFYRTVFDAEVARQSEVMAELLIAGSTLGIHNGGEGKRTWTGLSFQVGDLFAACDLLRTAGGTVLRQPEDTPEEPAHLAMCVDPEGNEIMLTLPRQR